MRRSIFLARHIDYAWRCAAVGYFRPFRIPAPYQCQPRPCQRGPYLLVAPRSLDMGLLAAPPAIDLADEPDDPAGRQARVHVVAELVVDQATVVVVGHRVALVPGRVFGYGIHIED